MSEESVEYVAVPLPALQAVVNYLGNQKHCEVHSMIALLVKCPRVVPSEPVPADSSTGGDSE